MQKKKKASKNDEPGVHVRLLCKQQVSKLSVGPHPPPLPLVLRHKVPFRLVIGAHRRMANPISEKTVVLCFFPLST